MLELADAWTWDCWFVDDGERFHAFYLKASKALLDPERRHLNATVGHAVSTDLRQWEEVADALVPDDDPTSFDHVATWSGSVARGPDGLWRMYYTGRASAEPVQRQRISWAESEDLMSWRRPGAQVLEADGRWYERWGDSAWGDEAWRDPWVYQDPEGAWHMLITARAGEGEWRERGVLGHAGSADGESWTVGEPWSRPGIGFAQLEVPQLVQVEGRWAVIFSCFPSELSGPRSRAVRHSGMWACEVPSPRGPWDLSAARPLTTEELYAGKVVAGRDGRPVLLAFRQRPDRGFLGGICDPLPLAWGEHGLELLPG